MKSFSDVKELPLNYRHLIKGRQFAVVNIFDRFLFLKIFFLKGDNKLRARRQNDSTSEFYCFQKNSKGNEAQLSKKLIEGVEIFILFSRWF